MTRFKTLLHREWMQHHRGWLLLMTLPPALLLVVLLFGGTIQAEPNHPLALMILSTVGISGLVLVITWLAVLLQAGGLARRDQQDRSIEFWLSLPVGHAQSLAATLLMHALAMPLLALTIGFASSQLIAQLVVWRVTGSAGWAELPWLTLLPLACGLFLRAALGVVLATAWMLPLLLVPMACSAWLKRWGVPIAVAGTAILHGLLAKLYGITVIGDTLHGWLVGASRSMISTPPPGWDEHTFSIDTPRIPGWLFGDAGHSIALMAQPLFLASLVVSAACFGLLVLRRRAGA